MAVKGKKYADLQKEIRSLRLRIAELEGKKLQSKQMDAMQKSELLYRTLMENVHFGITLIDTDRRIVMTNAGMSRFCKKPESEIVGNYCFREFEKRETICPHCPGTRAMATGLPAAVETEGIGDDGSRMAVRIQAIPVFGADGTAKGFIEVIEDLTERKKTENELQKSDMLYRTLIENIHVGISLIDTKHRIVMTNIGQGRILKKPRSKFIGKYCYREFEKRDEICPHCPGEISMATGRPAEVQTVGIRDDGTRVSVFLRTFPVFESDGSISGFIEIVEDITEHKRTEESLKESEQRFKAIFDNAADGILLADAKTKELYMGNKVICEMLGYSQGEFKNLTVSDIHPEESLPYVSEQFEKQVRKEVMLAADIPVKRRDGSVFYADVNAFPIMLSGKTYLMGIFRDVTERRQAEEKLKESEERFKAIFDNAADGILLADAETRKFYLGNEAACKMLGYRPEEIKNLTVLDTAPREFSSYAMEQFGKIVRGEASLVGDGDVPVKRKDGSIFYAAISAFPITLGGKTYITGVLRDITERKRIEEELNTYRERMSQAERLASLGTLSATVAHELTQPLTVIRLSIENSLDSLEATSCCETVVDGLKDALDEVTNATSVVDRFRNYARQSTKKTLCEINLGTIAGRIVRLLSKTAQRKKMTLNLKGFDELPPVYSDEKDLEQLFFALTENAIHAANGRKNNQLTISGDLKGKNVELRFVDNCCGISSENLDKIFDPFFTTSSDGGGTGLGLPIVQQIVSLYGGKIRVQSQLGKGTTFYIILPIRPK